MSKARDALLNPLVNENPITLQVLGICSALAITKLAALGSGEESRPDIGAGIRECLYQPDTPAPAGFRAHHRADDDHYDGRHSRRPDTQELRARYGRGP